MATYTPGSQSYMPDWQPFTPDYKFLSNVLDVKTDRYNTNYKALNDLYGKVVYSDLSRKDTQDARNQYAEKLGAELQKISGLDLSISQNVDAAKQLFKPFYENDLIVKDLVFTKQYQQSMQTANDLMNSSSKENRDMYWQTGVKALEYQMEDFQNADQNQALSMGLPSYVKNANLYEKAVEYLKGSGLEVTQEYVDETGFFIIKDKNGALITEQALFMAQQALSDDPLVQQAYYTEAYVASRDHAKAGLESGQFKSVDEGQRAWATDVINQKIQQLTKQSMQDNDAAIAAKNAMNNWKRYLDETGVIEGSSEEAMYDDAKSSYQLKLAKSQHTQNKLKGVNTSQEQSTNGLLNAAYNLMIGANMNADLSAAAVTYSNINKSRELKVNEYKKQQLKFKHDYNMESLRFNNSLKLEGVKQANRMQLEALKQSFEKDESSLEKGYNDLFGLEPLYNRTGSESVPLDSDGNPIMEGGDYVNLNDQNIAKHSQAIINDQIDFITESLHLLENNPNNVYEIGPIKGTLKEIKKQLRDPKNAKLVDDQFKIYMDKLNDSNELVKNNPNAARGSGSQDYHALLNRGTTISAKRHNLDNAIDHHNKTLYENYTTLMGTNLTKEVEKVQSSIDNGGLSIFKKEKTGPKLMTKEEFVKAYVEKAAGHINNPNGETITRDNGDPLYSKKMTKQQKNLLQQNGKIYDVYTGKLVTANEWYSSKRRFFKDRAAKDAAKMYDMQYGMLNATLDGSLETPPEGNLPPTRIFKPVDVNQIIRGANPESIETGDALKNPVYSKYIDPKTVYEDPQAFEMLKNLINQVRNTPSPDITFHKGDIGQLEESEESTDPNAKALYDLVMMRLGTKDPKKVPGLRITYAPTYGATGKNTLGKDEAAYIIEIDPDWISKNAGSKNAPGFTRDMDVKEYSAITVSFDQTYDGNPRNATSYNISNIMTELNAAENSQVVRNVESGGSLRIYEDGNSHVMAEVEFLTNDPTKGLSTSGRQVVNLTQTQRENNQSISYIDNLVTELMNRLQQNAKLNNNNRKESKK